MSSSRPGRQGGSGHGSLQRAIAGALRSTIRDHGPIKLEHIGSATKRIVGAVKNHQGMRPSSGQGKSGPPGGLRQGTDSANEARATFVFPAAGGLLSVAQCARARMETSPAGSPRHADDGLTAIVFAAIAVEAFINEFGESAQRHAERHGGQPFIDSLGAALGELIQSRAPTAIKFMAASVMLGQPYSRGARPFAELQFLFRLRNCLAHQKGVTYRWTWDTDEPLVEDDDLRSIVKGLRDRSLLTEREAASATSWRSKIGRIKVAAWAIETAKSTVVATVAKLPDDGVDGFKALVRTLYDPFVAP